MINLHKIQAYILFILFYPLYDGIDSSLEQ